MGSQFYELADVVFAQLQHVQFLFCLHYYFALLSLHDLCLASPVRTPHHQHYP